MLDKQIRPYAINIYDYGKKQPGANLIDADIETVRKVLMPRTDARFSRNGLIANGLRYSNKEYIEEFLQGKEAIVKLMKCLEQSTTL